MVDRKLLFKYYNNNKILLTALLIVSILFSCGKINENKHIQASGIIQEQGISTYQYGSHILIGENNTYALRSETINLDIYIGKAVDIKGEKISGYPVDGGPEYIEVLEVKE